MSINDDILYKIDSEIEKDKEVVKLKREIERLGNELQIQIEDNVRLNEYIEEKGKEIERLNNLTIEFDKSNKFIVQKTNEAIEKKNEEIERLKDIIDRAYKEAKKQDEEADYQEETDLSIIVNILQGSDKK